MATVDLALGKSLHDRATRGDSLSNDEQMLLDVWYMAEDDAERDLLQNAEVIPDVGQLRSDIAATLARVVEEAQQVKTLLVQNEMLYREVKELKRQVSTSKLAAPV